MALTRTTLSLAALATDRVIQVTSATGFVVGRKVLIEDERTEIVSVDGTNIGLGLRGQGGTKASDHNILSPVIVSDGTVGDWPVTPKKHAMITYGAAGAIAIPEYNAVIALVAASAAAMTIADPSKAMDGLELCIIAQAAQAYTLTNTTGFGAGGGSLDVGTFGGAIGDNIVIVALGGKWHVKSKINVTLA